MTLHKSFNDWAFHQCVRLGHEIKAIGRNHLGENILWINTTTREEYNVVDFRLGKVGDAPLCRN